MNVRGCAAFLIALMCALGARPAAAQDPADAAWGAGEHARARQLYAQRVAADSSDIRALHRLGLLRSWNREFAEAVRLFDRALQLTPGDTAIAHARARVLSWAGNYGAAEDAYRAMLSSSPSDAEALRGLARVASWRGDLQQGEDLWRDVVARHPDDVDARIGLSQVLRWRGQPRAALLEAETAVRLAPQNRDAQLQLAWAEAAFAPRISPSVSAEFDSDDNQLVTSALTITGYATPRVALTAHGYHRRAEDLRLDNISSWGVSLGTRVDVANGLMVGVSGGVVKRDAPDADATPIFAASVSSPPWHPVSVSAGFGRTVLDATALLIERGIEIDEANVAVGAQVSPGVRLESSLAYSRYRGETTNDRLLGRLGVEARIAPWLRVRPRVMAFDFEKHVNEGYFNPDFYMLGELGVGIDRYRGAWSFNAEAAPGVQQIGSAGDLTGAFSARLRIGYAIAPGRDVGLSLAMSNLGIERFEADAAGYRYQAAVVSASWSF